jgi:hypothetical protein
MSAAEEEQHAASDGECNPENNQQFSKIRHLTVRSTSRRRRLADPCTSGSRQASEITVCQGNFLSLPRLPIPLEVFLMPFFNQSAVLSFSRSLTVVVLVLLGGSLAARARHAHVSQQ